MDGEKELGGGDRDYVSIHEHVYFMYIYILVLSLHLECLLILL